MRVVFNLILMAAFSMGIQLLPSGLTGGIVGQSGDEQSAAVIEKREVEAFFDQFVPDQLREHHIPGATIAVVKDGATVIAKGYGYSRLDKKVPVDPDQSLFRIASVTKLFTWTAVMQLGEDGKLDLDTDVNEYLSAFQLPETYSEPVTLANLMSHTAGFEDRGLIGTLAGSPDAVIPLEQYLVNKMPARVRPPGHVSAYSNYGGALAGYIVAEVSGRSYEQYVQEEIFAPLGMKQATAVQSPLENMATSYVYSDGNYRPVPFAYLTPVPEGGISASATSMSRFMIAHLEDGRFAGTSILREETVRQMHRQSFTHHPQLSGWAHGVEENRVNGHRVLEHGGLLCNFTCFLVLVPSERLGLFVAFNSRGGSRAGRELKEQFFHKFLPARKPVAVPPPSITTENLEHHAGWYTPCRSSQTTLAKLGTLIQASPVTVNRDHSLMFLGRNWLPREPDLFQAAAGAELLAAKKNPRGQVEYLFIRTSAWKRLPWYQAPVFQVLLVVSCLLTFLSTIVVWPLGYLRTRGFRNGADSAQRVSRMARSAACICSTINLVFVIAIAIILSGDTSALEFGVPLGLRLLMILPLVSTVLAVGTVIFSIISWKKNWWNRFGRLHYTGVAVASMAFVWFLGFWNLLGWRF